MTSASAAPAAYTMAATPSAKVPTPSSPSIFTRTSVASGATPMVPSPLSAAATVPAVCEPWLNGSAKCIRETLAREVPARGEVDVRHEIRMVRVEARVEHRDARAVAPLTCIPRLGCIHRVVPVLQIEELVVVTARRRVRELRRSAPRPSGAVDELDLHVRHDRADLRGLRLEVGARRARTAIPTCGIVFVRVPPAAATCAWTFAASFSPFARMRYRLRCRRRGARTGGQARTTTRAPAHASTATSRFTVVPSPCRRGLGATRGR